MTPDDDASIRPSPDTSPVRAAFDAYAEAVLERLSADPRVVGVVGMGSTAERWRVDEWSDHDLAVVVSAGHEDALRYERGWLPDADRLVVDVIEGHGGGKLVFDDGRVIEFGVATPDGLRAWAVELTHPDRARALAVALRGDERALALTLLDLTEEWFAGRPELPVAGVRTVRTLLA